MGLTKYVLPVVVGAMAGMILITLGEMWIETMFPLPAGTDKYDVDSLAKAMKTMPDKAFVLLLVNYMICSFGAGAIATLVAKRVLMRPAIVVGIVLTLAGLYNVINLPHPAWFTAVNLIVYLPFAYLGYLVTRKKTVDTGK
jgi:hypothetical protein